MMRRLGVAWLVGCVLLPSWEASAWAPNAHQKLADLVASDPVIAPLLRARGLSLFQLRYYAIEADANMPSTWKHGDWDGVASWAAFQRVWLDERPIDNRSAGYLLHILGDVSVPVCHAPASRRLPGMAAPFCDNAFENFLEPFVELHTARMKAPPATPIALPAARPAAFADFDALASAHLGRMKGIGGFVDRARAAASALKPYLVCQACSKLGVLGQALSAQCRTCKTNPPAPPASLPELAAGCWQSVLPFARVAFAAYLTYGRTR